ncbi:hypothetical protein CQJ27_04230 [Escherichia sp. E1130]|nr:hypothetical protein CQB02_10880 [Escherichia coli]TGC08876.1 hypothetical protein CRG93_11145 [Escherichia sp. E2593]TGC18841.1 hypothetical protein CQJ28_05445 [Escherichia sp. E2562]TGC19042.1 hypothetical protein CRU79_02080 [Escherichia sp. E4385]TGC27308.1 hypothetical protein CQJ27_04230 [Escherichia sp. E1130]
MQDAAPRLTFTLLFFFITGGHVPSYLGSSAAFVGVVIAATGFNGQGINPNISIALGGFTLGGIGTATFGAILLNALLSRKLVDVPPPEVVHQEP